MTDLRSELAWLFEEFESLSNACQNEYGFAGDTFEEDRQRAKAIQPLLGWQPIDTAPKDGTTVFLYCGKYISYVADIGSWEDGEWAMSSSGWEPTHWMLLPDPPKD